MPGYSELDFIEKRERLKSYKSPFVNNVKLILDKKDIISNVDKNSFKFKQSLLDEPENNRYSYAYNFNTNISSTLKNSHDYQFSEAYEQNDNNIIKYGRKPVTQFDCINYTYKSIQPDCIVKQNIPEFYKK